MTENEWNIKRLKKCSNAINYFVEHPDQIEDWMLDAKQLATNIGDDSLHECFLQDISIFLATKLTQIQNRVQATLRPAVKKALLVGINKHSFKGSDLRGCVNDVQHMRNCLSSYYGFNLDNIRVLTDLRATKKEILARLDWLIDDAQAGDELVFHYSGHGCFSGDTKVSLLNGKEITFKDLAKDYSDQKFWVYSMDDGVVVPGLAHSPRITKRDRLIMVQIDNGETIKCTEDHLFLLRDGKYKMAKNLTNGDSLMPLYRRISSKKDKELDSYEMCYIPNDEFRKTLEKEKVVGTCKQEYIYTHRLVGYNQGFIKTDYKGVLHHVDYNKRNNSPSNLKFLTRKEHAKIHTMTEEQEEQARQRRILWNKTVWPEKMKDKKFREAFGEKSSEERKKNWQDPKYREKVCKGISASYDKKNFDNDPRIKALHENRHKSHTKDAMEKKYKSFKKTSSDENGKLYKANHSEARKQQLSEANKKANHIRWHANRNIYNENCDYCQEKVINHKVISIIYTNEYEDCYDITVEKYHNFALSSGVFVHNSQIRDRDGDELDDNLDEILIPSDHNWNEPLTDDYLANIFKKVPAGANLTMICDACHSGTMTRGFSMSEIDLDSIGSSLEEYDIIPRTIDPPFDLMARSEGRGLTKRIIGKSQVESQRHVLISGCHDKQTSADAYINNKYQGALTWALTRAIEENPNSTWKQIHKRIANIISRYPQTPQLSGDDDRISRKLFGGKV